MPALLFKFCEQILKVGGKKCVSRIAVAGADRAGADRAGPQRQCGHQRAEIL